MSSLKIDPGRFQEIPQRQKKTEKSSRGFVDMVKNAIARVNDEKNEADRNIEQLAKGKTGIHETMISIQKADISFRLLLQVRNKAMEAYREIMRMPF